MVATDIDHLEIDSGEIVCFVGPSGCGKTTALRTVAGLLSHDEGDVYFGDRLVNDLPPERRNAAMVFQNYALFPHMTVFDNVAFGLTVRKKPPDEIADKVRSVLDLVQLPDVGERYPNQLSGGQQQRIAVARALATEPDILLFDEPLSNLDAKLREYMRFELRQLLENLKITTVYVTHDQTEAMVIGDRLIVMNAGRILQDAPPSQVYHRPADRFVADFIGTVSIVEGRVAEAADADGLVQLRTSDGLSFWGNGVDVGPGETAVACIRPEAIQFAPGSERGRTQQVRGRHRGRHGSRGGQGDPPDRRVVEVAQPRACIHGPRGRRTDGNRNSRRALHGCPAVSEFDQHPSGNMVRFVSYNTQFCTGLDGHTDLDRIAAEIASADVMALQEIDRHWQRTGHVDQADALAERFPDYHWAYGPGVDVDASYCEPNGRLVNRRRQFGNMVLARWPILMVRNHLLPKLHLRSPLSLQRAALETVVALPDGPCRVVSVHLAHAASSERLLQIERLMEMLETAPRDGGAWSGTRLCPGMGT